MTGPLGRVSSLNDGRHSMAERRRRGNHGPAGATGRIGTGAQTGLPTPGRDPGYRFPSRLLHKAVSETLQHVR